MRTRPSHAPPELRECRIRAALLLKALRSGDPERSPSAAARIQRVEPFARMSVEEIVSRAESVQRKHALAAVATELGFATWAELRDAKVREAEHRLPEHLFGGRSSAFLNRWFTSHAEAIASQQRDRGFLFPFRTQFFVCEAGFLQARGIDVRDPDWERIGFDWAHPADPAARARLGAKLAQVLKVDVEGAR